MIMWPFNKKKIEEVKKNKYVKEHWINGKLSWTEEIYLEDKDWEIEDCFDGRKKKTLRTKEWMDYANKLNKETSLPMVERSSSEDKLTFKKPTASYAESIVFCDQQIKDIKEMLNDKKININTIERARTIAINKYKNDKNGVAFTVNQEFSTLKSLSLSEDVSIKFNFLCNKYGIII